MVWYLRIPNEIFSWYVASFQKTPSQGAYSSVFCAAASEEMLPPSGSFIHNCKPCPLNSHAESTHDAKRLWQVSESLVGM